MYIIGTNKQAPTTHVKDSIRAGKVPIYGVNLGGWLVVEHWINSDDALWNGVPDSVENYKFRCALNNLNLLYFFSFKGFQWRRIHNDAKSRPHCRRSSFPDSLGHFYYRTRHCNYWLVVLINRHYFINSISIFQILYTSQLQSEYRTSSGRLVDRRIRQQRPFKQTRMENLCPRR